MIDQKIYDEALKGSEISQERAEKTVRRPEKEFSSTKTLVFPEMLKKKAKTNKTVASDCHNIFSKLADDNQEKPTENSAFSEKNAESITHCTSSAQEFLQNEVTEAKSKEISIIPKNKINSLNTKNGTDLFSHSDIVVKNATNSINPTQNLSMDIRNDNIIKQKESFDVKNPDLLSLPSKCVKSNNSTDQRQENMSVTSGTRRESFFTRNFKNKSEENLICILKSFRNFDFLKKRCNIMQDFNKSLNLGEVVKSNLNDINIFHAEEFAKTYRPMIRKPYYQIEGLTYDSRFSGYLEKTQLDIYDCKNHCFICKNQPRINNITDRAYKKHNYYKLLPCCGCKIYILENLKILSEKNGFDNLDANILKCLKARLTKRFSRRDEKQQLIIAKNFIDSLPGLREAAALKYKVEEISEKINTKVGDSLLQKYLNYEMLADFGSSFDCFYQKHGFCVDCSVNDFEKGILCFESSKRENTVFNDRIPEKEYFLQSNDDIHNKPHAYPGYSVNSKSINNISPIISDLSTVNLSKPIKITNAALQPKNLLFDDRSERKFNLLKKPFNEFQGGKMISDHNNRPFHNEIPEITKNSPEYVKDEQESNDSVQSDVNTIKISHDNDSKTQSYSLSSVAHEDNKNDDCDGHDCEFTSLNDNLCNRDDQKNIHLLVNDTNSKVTCENIHLMDDNCILTSKNEGSDLSTGNPAINENHETVILQINSYEGDEVAKTIKKKSTHSGLDYCVNMFETDTNTTVKDIQNVAIKRLTIEDLKELAQVECSKCWICLTPETDQDSFVSPCGCLGDTRNVHRSCFCRFLDAKKHLENITCAVCKHKYRISFQKARFLQTYEFLGKFNRFICNAVFIIFLALLVYTLVLSYGLSLIIPFVGKEAFKKYLFKTTDYRFPFNINFLHSLRISIGGPIVPFVILMSNYQRFSLFIHVLPCIFLMHSFDYVNLLIALSPIILYAYCFVIQKIEKKLGRVDSVGEPGVVFNDSYIYITRIVVILMSPYFGIFFGRIFMYSAILAKRFLHLNINIWKIMTWSFVGTISYVLVSDFLGIIYLMGKKKRIDNIVILDKEDKKEK